MNAIAAVDPDVSSAVSDVEEKNWGRKRPRRPRWSPQVALVAEQLQKLRQREQREPPGLPVEGESRPAAEPWDDAGDAPRSLPMTKDHDRGGAGRPPPFSTGIEAVDAWLPGGGLAAGSLVDWIGSTSAAGAWTLAVRGAWHSAIRAGPKGLVIVDPTGEFYPPALVPHGIDWQRVIVVRPASPKEALWAVEQSLRGAGIGAVVAPLDRMASKVYRRLQLAAENAGTLAMLLRPPRAKSEPSWADVRLVVEPRPMRPREKGRRWRVELLRCRGSLAGQAVELEWDDAAGSVRLAPELAAAALEPGATRDPHAGRAAG